jgi:hypothetical protein
MIRIAMLTAVLAGLAPLAHAQRGPAAVASDVDPLVRVTQLDAAGQPVGTSQSTRCPPNGCQLPSVLRIAETTTPFQTVVTFAGQGVYVVLESPNTGAQIHLYGDPRPTPLFLPNTAGNLNRLVHIVVDQPSGGRAITRTLATQDTWLRIEIDQNVPPSKPAG